MNHTTFNGPQYFKSFGYWLHRFTAEELAPVREAIIEIQKNFSEATPHRAKLAGNILHEYNLNEDVKNYLEHLILPICVDYDNEFNYLENINFLSEPRPLALNTPWVNFQRKHEFNPLHKHSGIFSWVIWLQVPYLIENEIAVSPGKEANTPLAGHFEFNYINSLGQITPDPLPVDKRWENCMALFPASMLHGVHPFYSSDDYRISVSGNFICKV
jgi:hypothetical protein